MVTVLGLGDNVCDVYLHEGVMYPGGQALNFAVYAHQLGAGSQFMGVFGQDAVAEHVRRVLKEKGIGTSHCRSYPGENGFARVTLRDGDRVFMGSNRGGVIRQHPIFLDAADLAYVSGFQLIHTTNNGFTDGLLPQLRTTPSLISYDFSYRWEEEDRLRRVCPYVDFAFLSCSGLDDGQTEQLCRRLHSLGCGTVTATRGSLGALTYDGIRFYSQPPALVEAMDTMGAGDSFASAMLVSVLQALEKMPGLWSSEMVRASILPGALKRAAEFAAGTCLVHGAFGCGTPVPQSVRERICGDVS